MANAIYRLLMFAGSFVCHQGPDRSPHLWGFQAPLCWRCSGIFLGTGLLFVWLVLRKRPLPLSWCLPLASLMPLDVLTVVMGWRQGRNDLRFATGFLWGVFGSAAILCLLARLYSNTKLRRFKWDCFGRPLRKQC
jgi:uncharacterized membrane protein